MNSPANSRFKFFPQLNDLDRKEWLSSRHKFHSGITKEYFDSDSLQDTFLQAIAADRLLPVKEVLESFEFFTRVRKSVRTRVMADLCCGHGLVGILFAMFERDVDRVFLIDQNEPESRLKLIAAASKVAPWISEKIDNREAKIDIEDDWIKPDIGVVSAHACGVLSDLCIAVAIKTAGPIAILPCCYPRSACEAPLSLQTQFGIKTAFDIDRTYRLEKAGYTVRWGTIPAEITPMNRILYARPPRANRSV